MSLTLPAVVIPKKYQVKCVPCTSGEPQPVRVFDYARIEHTRPPARPLARSRTSTQSRWHRVCAHADMAESEPHALSIARARFLSPHSKITQKQSGRANRA